MAFALEKMVCLKYLRLHSSHFVQSISDVNMGRAIFINQLDGQMCLLGI